MGNLVTQAVDSGFLLTKTSKITVVLILLCLLIFFIIFIKEPIVVKSFIYRMFREAVIVQINWQTEKWDELAGEHFTVRYQPQDSNIARLVLETAEKSYEPISKRYGFISSSKITVVIYPTKESLGTSFGWAADESAMGVYWAGVIRVLSPNVWLNYADSQVLKEKFETEGPMAHELTHLIVDYVTGGNYTRWFTEGIAQYEESMLTGFQVEYREISGQDDIYPFDLMDREFDNLNDQGMAYFESFKAIQYLVDNYGEDSIKTILNDLGKGLTMEESFRRNTGVSLDQFENDFRRWIAADD